MDWLTEEQFVALSPDDQAQAVAEQSQPDWFVSDSRSAVSDQEVVAVLDFSNAPFETLPELPDESPN